MIADRFPEVSVLVADLVDFTPSSDRSSPERVVGVLDDLFTADMVAGGLPSPRPDHAQAVADMAVACARRSAATATRPGSRWPSASASTPARWWPG